MLQFLLGRAFVLAVTIFYVGILTIPALLSNYPQIPPGLGPVLLTTAAASTLATAISLPAAVLITFYGLRRGISAVLPAVTFSTAIPHTAIGLLLLPVFARLGIVDSFPAIVFAMAVVSTPIGIGTLTSLFSRRSQSLDEFLQSLSLKNVEIISFYLRSSPTSLATTFLLMWLRSFSELGAFLIVAMRPATIGVYIYEVFLTMGAPPAVTVAVIVALFGFVFSAILHILSRAAER